MPTELVKFPTSSDHNTKVVSRGSYYAIYCSCQVAPVDISYDPSKDKAEILADKHREGGEYAGE